MTPHYYMDQNQHSYDQAEKWCKQIIMTNTPLPLFYDRNQFRKILKETSISIRFPQQSLLSLVRTTHLEAVKVTTITVRRNIDFHIGQYCNGETILGISKSAGFPPFLMARLLVEELTVSIGRKELAKIMREPRFITKDLILQKFEHSENVDISFSRKETRLSYEVKEAIRSDPLYGPEHDRARHNIGVEYEVALEQTLKKMGIPFETESQLRQKGSARTPDVLLNTPVAFKMNSGEWKFVCWIDSKAMFGDIDTHGRTILPQCETYIHRFGPGMIIYWFGHAPIDRLHSADGDISVVGWRLPDFSMTPSGEKQDVKPR